MIVAPRPYDVDQEDPYAKAAPGSDSNADDPNATPGRTKPAPTTQPAVKVQPDAPAGDAPAGRDPLPPDPNPPATPPPADSVPPTTPASSGPVETAPPATAAAAQVAAQQAAAQNPTAPAGNAPAITPSTSADSLLPLLTGGAQGTNQTPLQAATTAATLAQLQNPNPYNSDAVKAEYSNLAGGIDADYDARQRGLTDQFARQGLSGSAGKDFASGRAADTEVGRRTAKEQLASELASNQAKSQGEYTNAAINQGQAGSQQGVNNSLAYTRSLMDYGQNAFGNDLATSQFQEQQNNDQQQQLLQLLAAGYGA